MGGNNGIDLFPDIGLNLLRAEATPHCFFFSRLANLRTLTLSLFSPPLFPILTRRIRNASFFPIFEERSQSTKGYSPPFFFARGGDFPMQIWEYLFFFLIFPFRRGLCLFFLLVWEAFSLFSPRPFPPFLPAGTSNGTYEAGFFFPPPPFFPAADSFFL